MGYWIVDGRKLSNEEYAELQRQLQREKECARGEEFRLTKQLGEAYAALKKHLRDNPRSEQQVTDESVLNQQIYQNLWHNLEGANRAPRCSRIKPDGTQCGSPKMRNHIYCYAHMRMIEAQAQQLVLPALEDANGIQMALMLVQRALIDDEISEKKAGLLLYSLQIAAGNVDKTTFGQAADEEMMVEGVPENETMEQHEVFVERQKKLEAIREKAIPKENHDLPRVNADELGYEPRTDKMLPQPVGTGGGVEVHANLG
jgi:hypothetical protein